MHILCFNKKLFLLLRKTCIFVLLVTFVLKNLLKRFVSVFFSFSYIFFLRCNSHTIKSSKVCNSLVFNIFTKLCDHYLVLEHLYHSKKRPYAHWHRLFVSMHFPILSISCKHNYMCFFFCARFLKTMFSRFIYLYYSMYQYLIPFYCTIICHHMNTKHLVYQVKGHLVCFHFSAIMNVMNISASAQDFMWTYVFNSLGYTCGNGTDGYGNSIFNYFMNCQTVFQISCTSLFFYQPL